MKDSELKITRQLNAPIELVWEVITKREHLKEWYFDFAEDWQVELGNEFEWIAGDQNGTQWLHAGKMLEIVDGKKLVHSWQYPGYSGYSIVTWELKKLSDTSTEILLTQYFEVPFDPNVEALRKENFVEGWTHIINISIVDYLKKINQ